MQIVIDIPKTIYEEMMETAIMVTEVYPSTIERALTEGIPYEERKTGKWVRQGGIHNMYTRYACSECGREIDVYYDFGNIPTDADVINAFPYCHCGAKMEVDE